MEVDTQPQAQITKAEKKSSERQKKLLALNAADQGEYAKKVKKLRKSGVNKQKKIEPAVLYVGHLPAQFSEPSLRKYFEQFGRIIRLRLSRSKRTGKSKGYAFFEYDDAKNARIAAKTMDKYLFHERLLVCKVMDKTKVHEHLWKGANMKFMPGLCHRANRARLYAEKTPAHLKRTARQRKNKDGALLAALKAVGIADFKFPNSESKAAEIPESPVKPPKEETVVEATPVKKGKKKTAAPTPRSTRKQRKRPFPEAKPE
ncbi:unnamed protein product [Oikopleura dioica]|uniref:RRM domain-containing protein n=1 Tax=Oikopleura dioica TaxID=34765 RepID=E4WQJ3_OIKDI|nr:unnamed protein product [Oikopleura dioica]